jgi:hypothetical protein
LPHLPFESEPDVSQQDLFHSDDGVGLVGVPPIVIHAGGNPIITDAELSRRRSCANFTTRQLAPDVFALGMDCKQQNVLVAKSALSGVGVYPTRDFKAGEIVLYADANTGDGAFQLRPSGESKDILPTL